MEKFYFLRGFDRQKETKRVKKAQKMANGAFFSSLFFGEQVFDASKEGEYFPKGSFLEERMIRGAKKQMIVLHTGSSPYFDTAYFILKNKQSKERAPTGDMLAEANRILCENQPSRPSGRLRFGRLVSFFAGLLCGAAVAVGILLCVFLL